VKTVLFRNMKPFVIIIRLGLIHRDYHETESIFYE